jgi:hypothetical protein
MQTIPEASPDMLLADLPLDILQGKGGITDTCYEKVNVEKLQALQRKPAHRRETRE